MSELINNSSARKEKLKELILKLHKNEDPEKVRQELIVELGKVPYADVVAVEQELIKEGLPIGEILKLCDIHGKVLRGQVDLSGMKDVPEGHPVDVLRKENREIEKLGKQIQEKIEHILKSGEYRGEQDLLELRHMFNTLYDVDKHYKRKEYLIFPFLEKYGVTGPTQVMWGKHDEIRQLFAGVTEALKMQDMSYEEFQATAEWFLLNLLDQVLDMVKKEEEILIPIAVETLSEQEWFEVEKQSVEIGFCLYDPPKRWTPNWAQDDPSMQVNSESNTIHLPSGTLTVEELVTILNLLPVDITFVDKNDKVKYFSQSKDRVFQRNRAILNRDVRYCHPPASVHIVDKILTDFRSGVADKAPFWINMRGNMIFIEYIALRNEKGEYLGTLEVSHNVQRYRDLQGEQRILNYEKK